ncbi:MAG: ImmA/IrrE family metallo-endopeptidase [Actinomycetota bacterium]|nr:ImmA/IrrE family metallo-endopeptidase [Actinomycetota bacterium]
MAIQQEAERAANRLLRDVWPWHGDNPKLPVDPIRIARSLGIDVYDAELGQDVFGALVKEAGQDPTILLNAIDSPNRKRFSCAHEIGHFVRRSDTVYSNISDYDQYTHLDRRDVLSAQGVDIEEIYANSFAAALLMPAALVEELRKTQSPTDLALTFDVSQEAMQYRLLNLGLQSV